MSLRKQGWGLQAARRGCSTCSGTRCYEVVQVLSSSPDTASRTAKLEMTAIEWQFLVHALHLLPVKFFGLLENFALISLGSWPT